jgi:hypothetical protein
MSNLPPLTPYDLHAALGYKRLDPAWAKIEIFLGLVGGGGGLLLGVWAVSRPTETEWLFALVGLLLFVLGGYLALAGHRSHLYQSNNQLTAFVIGEIRRLRSGHETV